MQRQGVNQEGEANDGTPIIHATVLSASVDQNDPRSSASSRPSTDRVNNDDDLPVAVHVPPPTATSTNIHSLVTPDQQEDEDRANADDDMPGQNTIRNQIFRILLGSTILIVAFVLIIYYLIGEAES